MSGALAGGPTAISTFCAAGCNRDMACAALADAGTVDVGACVSSCEAFNDGTLVALYRTDYMAALTSCVASASCADTLANNATTSCGPTALAAVPQDQDLISLCTSIDSLPGGCVSSSGCLSTYKVLNDKTLQALAACVATPNYCSNIDAGAGCFAMALAP